MDCWICAVVSILPIFITYFLCTNERYRWFYILYKTLPRDLKGAYRGAKGYYLLYHMKKNQETIPTLFSKVAKENSKKVAFYFEDETWTFQQLEDLSNKVANHFISLGYKKGDTVALLLENCPEYAAIWIGLSKAGVVAAFINTNLRSGPLYHCITAASCKALIFGSEFVSAVEGIKSKLEDTELFYFGTSETANSITEASNLKIHIEDQSVAPPTEAISQLAHKDKAILIYTSGTTGLPKAATITHSRYIFASTGLNILTDMNKDDIFYNPLPLYHSSGGMVGIGQSLFFGISVVLRKKFSASNFWTDCNKYKCTIANYIGETCRYILLANKEGQTPKHGIKKMVGNGLRKEIWKDFVNTFDIPEIYEFYGSTEGNANLMNIDNTIGAVGFLPPFSDFIYPLSLIKSDEITNEPLRNEEGFCIRCKDYEAGLLIGKIDYANAANDFAGYTDGKETSKKILRDVFKKGDGYFNSGDLMMRDEFRYMYFKDRTGDTYRWKGENVATTEVETVAAEIIGAKDVVVYGVQVPESEGRAGMIAIADPDKTLDLKHLSKGMKSHLPGYAIPLFLRVLESLPVTGTFKVKKVELRKDGFDMTMIKDPMYFLMRKSQSTFPLNKFTRIL
ncbi:hypothetical protein JTB14_024724 [Gonioctena quinquepunctata]|nr:hypothetical protein JTB14_024724 [Gonioctena quinquepunctata]